MSRDTVTSLETAKRNLAQKSELFRMTFGTISGEKVLRYLEEEFAGSTPYTLGDSHDTARKVGNQEVIDYIRAMLQYNQSED